MALALIIGLLLLVFDHSKSFRYLGLFAIFKALTNYLSVVLDFGYQSEYVDSVVCIIQIFTFLYGFYAWQFLHCVFRYESPNLKIEALVICSSLTTIAPTLLFFSFRYVFWIYIDVIMGLLILAYTLHFCLSQYNLNKLKFKQWSRNVNYYSMGVLLFAALTLLTSSYEGLTAFHFSGTPDLLDFKITLVVPLFLMASLIDIGSVVKYTEFLKLDVARKTALEKELILGQELQRELLPDKRGNGDFYTWRTLFKPAVYVSGDWHDVGIIKFKGGETLLAGAIVDITGHGVRAAIMSNNVATHYLEWKDMCQYSNCPDSDQGLRNLVEECIFKVNYSLFVQKYKVGAAMTMFVMTSNGKLIVSCQGQSGLVLFDMDNNFTRYIATSGGRLGSTIESLNIATEFTRFDENESGFYFFTDGILSQGQTMGRFLSRLKGKSGNNAPVSTIINRSIRKSRKFLSLKSQGMQDDLTLIRINFKS